MRTLFALTIFTLMITGCDSLFDIRPVEEPEQHTSSQWQPPTTPKQVLTNMENAVLEQNADNFMRCLSDSTAGEKPFRFVPDHETLANYPQVFADWSRADEKRVFQEMESNVPRDSLYQLVFSDKSEQYETSDSAQVEILYELRVHHTKENLPRDVSGRAIFTFSRNETQRNWVIHRWEDFKEETMPTWSELKAGF